MTYPGIIGSAAPVTMSIGIVHSVAPSAAHSSAHASHRAENDARSSGRTGTQNGRAPSGHARVVDIGDEHDMDPPSGLTVTRYAPVQLGTAVEREISASPSKHAGAPSSPIPGVPTIRPPAHPASANRATIHSARMAASVATSPAVARGGP